MKVLFQHVDAVRSRVEGVCGVSPGFCPPLSLHGPQLLPGDGKFGCVDHFRFPAVVGELQCAVPLALRFADDGVGRVVFDLGRHSEVVAQRLG